MKIGENLETFILDNDFTWVCVRDYSVFKRFYEGMTQSFTGHYGPNPTKNKVRNVHSSPIFNMAYQRDNNKLFI